MQRYPELSTQRSVAALAFLAMLHEAGLSPVALMWAYDRINCRFSINVLAPKKTSDAEQLWYCTSAKAILATHPAAPADIVILQLSDPSAIWLRQALDIIDRSTRRVEVIVVNDLVLRPKWVLRCRNTAGKILQSKEAKWKRDRVQRALIA